MSILLLCEIKKAFKEDASTCNMCFKLLQNQDKINPQIHIMWTENQKYRVFTNFRHSFLDNLFGKENIKDKSSERRAFGLQYTYIAQLKVYALSV